MLLDCSHGELAAREEAQNLYDTITQEAKGCGVSQDSLVRLAAAVAWVTRHIVTVPESAGLLGLVV